MPVSIPRTEENKPLIIKNYTDCMECRFFQYISNLGKQIKATLVTVMLLVRNSQTQKFGFLEITHTSKAE